MSSSDILDTKCWKSLVWTDIMLNVWMCTLCLWVQAKLFQQKFQTLIGLIFLQFHPGLLIFVTQWRKLCLVDRFSYVSDGRYIFTVWLCKERAELHCLGGNKLRFRFPSCFQQDRTLCDSGSRVLGYQVSYRPERKKQLQDTSIWNVTDVTVLLLAEEGNCSVTVRAYNTAGYGPDARLYINIQGVNGE